MIQKLIFPVQKENCNFFDYFNDFYTDILIILQKS